MTENGPMYPLRPPLMVSDMESGCPTRGERRAERMGDNITGDSGGDELLFLVGVAVFVCKSIFCCEGSCGIAVPSVVDERLHAPPAEEIFNLRVVELFRRRKRSVCLLFCSVTLTPSFKKN